MVTENLETENGQATNITLVLRRSYVGPLPRLHFRNQLETELTKANQNRDEKICEIDKNDRNREAKRFFLPFLKRD